MDEQRQEIIARVGRGELSPDDALRLLDEIDAREAAATEQATQAPADQEPYTQVFPPPTEALPPGGHRSLRTLRVHLAAGKVRIVGDPTVAGAEADGPCTLREEGDVLVVDCEPFAPRTRAYDDFGFVMGSRGRSRTNFRLPLDAGRSVRIRANPNLAVECQVAAGSAKVDGMHGAIRCEVAGGSLGLRDVRGPVEASVSAGSVTVGGVLREGDSKISCDMGSASVTLEPGSSVRVRAGVAMGKVAIHTGRSDGDEWVVGDGRATLALRGSMSSIVVNEA